MHRGLADFITSRVRVKILELFYADPEQLYYIREVTRKVDEEINAVRRELNSMVGRGILKTENRGNRAYFYVNKAYTYFPELQQMVLKSGKLATQMRRLHHKLGKVEFVMFSNQFINRRQEKVKELDILVVGDIVIPELEVLIKEEEKKLGREINYMVLNGGEFRMRKQRRDGFITEALYGKKVMVIGDEEEFVDRSIKTP
ncbi:hypothetical protein FWH30_01380 [Microgenomates group bacterium]|nr:hypothetical protein [Microgenomates group bacterium]